MYIFFDIGGTKMRVAASRDGEKIEEPRVVPTPQNYREGVEALCTITRELTGAAKIDAVYGGVAGPFDKDRSMALAAPNLPEWAQKPLKRDIEQALSTTVMLENDSALAALGEANFGAGRGYEIVAYMGVGTGIGGARIVGGRIDKNAIGFEIGHQIISEGGKRLHEYISGRTIQETYQKLPSEITDKEIWEHGARILAIGVHNMLVHWSPNVVVLGGSLVNDEWGMRVGQVREQVKNIVKIYPNIPEIKPATLKDYAGLYGALALLRQKNEIH